MTEDQIERAVERNMDGYDRALMAGRLTQAEYDAKVKALSAWADQQYRSRGR